MNIIPPFSLVSHSSSFYCFSVRSLSLFRHEERAKGVCRWISCCVIRYKSYDDIKVHAYAMLFGWRATQRLEISSFSSHVVIGMHCIVGSYKDNIRVGNSLLAFLSLLTYVNLILDRQNIMMTTSILLTSTFHLCMCGTVKRWRRFSIFSFFSFLSIVSSAENLWRLRAAERDKGNL